MSWVGERVGGGTLHGDMYHPKTGDSISRTDDYYVTTPHKGSTNDASTSVGGKLGGLEIGVKRWWVLLGHLSDPFRPNDILRSTRSTHRSCHPSPT